VSVARPSKLTDKQWQEIRKRLLAGEKPSDLAKEYKVSRATISERGSRTVGNIKSVANQLVAAESSLRALPVTEQLEALSLADELRAISSHLAGAARFGSATSHRLSGIAHAKVQEIDDAAPLDEESLEALKGVAVLTKLANESSVIGMNLLSANKDMVKQANQQEPVQPVRVFVRVEDASRPEPQAQ
jgi:hypothetical protein